MSARTYRDQLELPGGSREANSQRQLLVGSHVEPVLATGCTHLEEQGVRHGHSLRPKRIDRDGLPVQQDLCAAEPLV
eukprot:2932675-Prymnesium_polylepis.1